MRAALGLYPQAKPLGVKEPLHRTSAPHYARAYRLMNASSGSTPSPGPEGICT